MNFLVLSALDFRTPRKANMHFIASELRKRGVTRFFSLRYSGLSKWKHDPRLVLDDRANREEVVDGVDCFLWKTLVHPFNTRRPFLRPFEDAFFRRSQRQVPPILTRWIREADVIFFESGSSILHAALAEAIHPAARRIYVASDDLGTIHVADYVKREFVSVAPRMEALCLPSPLLASGMPAGTRCYFVPHGLEPGIADLADPTPYTGPRNAVSVGSMLFDRSFFERVAPSFPDVLFHVIGSGLPDGRGLGSNVLLYPEMDYASTLRYIKHADVGIAPYLADRVSPYLADTSMKLMQYRFFGVPAVCPTAVTGGASDRFGYDPGSGESIDDAMRSALAAPRRADRKVLAWSEVVDRLLDPVRFADTALTGPTGGSGDPRSGRAH